MLSGIDKMLNDALIARSMPVDQFAITATLDGIRFASKSKLFEAFRDVKPLGNETAVACWGLWKEIDTLARSVEPLTLNLKDGAKVHEWVTLLRAEQLRIQVGQPEQRQESAAQQYSAFLKGLISALSGRE